MDKENIRAYYDQFRHYQMSTALNERIFFLFEEIKKLGLNSHSKVLELGCGIGTFSYLLARVIRKGFVEAVDISPESVAVAEKKVSRSNFRFRVADINFFRPEQSTFDFITLFDVIEHIPLAEHEILFTNISSYMEDHTRLLVNIPNPRYIRYEKLHHPETLQVVDEEVSLDGLAHILIKHGMYIHNFRTHSVWVKDDYQFIEICRDKKFNEIKLAENRSLSARVRAKWKRMINRFRYRY